MKHVVHILKTLDGWHATFNGIDIRSVASHNKNRVVQRAISLSKRLYAHAVLVIHGADGRVLEDREITNIKPAE